MNNDNIWQITEDVFIRAMLKRVRCHMYWSKYLTEMRHIDDNQNTRNTFNVSESFRTEKYKHFWMTSFTL